MSKYYAVILAPSLLVFLLMSSKYRHWLGRWRPWVEMTIAVRRSARRSCGINNVMGVVRVLIRADSRARRKLANTSRHVLDDVVGGAAAAGAGAR